MREVLYKAIQNKTMVEIYSIQDEGTFDVGIPIKLYDEDFIISRVSKEGELLGYCAIMYEDVLMLKENTNYLKRLDRLVTDDDTNPCFDDDSAVLFVLNHALRNNLNLDIYFYPPFNDTVYGRCVSLDGSVVAVQEYSKRGTPDGTTYLEIDSTRSCFCE